jgi:cytochrome c553
MQGRSLILAGVLAAGAALADDGPRLGDAQAARGKISMCIGCHGIPGYRTSFPEVYSVPKLGGQHPEYIIRALRAYKNGERSHPTMRGIAASLSEQDMADLAAYYGTGR